MGGEWYGGDGAMPFVQVVDVGFDMKLVPDTKNKISKLAQAKSVFVPKGTAIVTLQGSIVVSILIFSYLANSFKKHNHAELTTRINTTS